MKAKIIKWLKIENTAYEIYLDENKYLILEKHLLFDLQKVFRGYPPYVPLTKEITLKRLKQTQRQMELKLTR